MGSTTIFCFLYFLFKSLPGSISAIISFLPLSTSSFATFQLDMVTLAQKWLLVARIFLNKSKEGYPLSRSIKSPLPQNLRCWLANACSPTLRLTNFASMLTLLRTSYAFDILARTTVLFILLLVYSPNSLMVWTVFGNITWEPSTAINL